MGDITASNESPLVVEINTLVSRFVEEKNSELERIRKERNKMREEMEEMKKQNEKLALENKELETRQKELVETYTVHLNKIEKTVERLGNENEELEKKLEEEKRIKEQVVTEYCEIYGKRAVLMDLVRERIQAADGTRKRCSLSIGAGEGMD